jgi:hypothetical protein
MEWLIWIVLVWVVLSAPAAMAVGHVLAFGSAADTDVEPIAEEHAARAA